MRRILSSVSPRNYTLTAKNSSTSISLICIFYSMRPAQNYQAALSKRYIFIIYENILKKAPGLTFPVSQTNCHNFTAHQFSERCDTLDGYCTVQCISDIHSCVFSTTLRSVLLSTRGRRNDSKLFGAFD